MIAYLARRIVQSILILIGISAITFALLYLLPADPVRRSGPGLSVDVPRRPRGKTGTVDLSDDADAEEEADGEARMARSQGAARRPKSRSVQVGWGEQSDDAKAHSPFGKGKGPRKS